MPSLKFRMAELKREIRRLNLFHRQFEEDDGFWLLIQRDKMTRVQGAPCFPDSLACSINQGLYIYRIFGRIIESGTIKDGESFLDILRMIFEKSALCLNALSSKEEDESLNRAEVDKSDQNDESQEMEEKANRLKKKRLIKCSGYFQTTDIRELDSLVGLCQYCKSQGKRRTSEDFFQMEVLKDFDADLKQSVLDEEKDRNDQSEPDMKTEIVDTMNHKKEIKKRKRSISGSNFESQKEGYTENTNDESENLDLLLELKVHDIESETPETEVADNKMKGLLTEPDDEVMKYGAISNSLTYPQLCNEDRSSAITEQNIENTVPTEVDPCQFSSFKENPQSVIKSNPYKLSQENHQHCKVQLNEGTQDENENLEEEQIQNAYNDDEKDEDNLLLINEDLKIDIPQDEADINVQSDCEDIRIIPGGEVQTERPLKRKRGRPRKIVAEEILKNRKKLSESTKKKISENNKKFSICKLCGSHCKGFRGLVDHMYRDHPTHKPWSCTYCPVQTPFVKTLYRHLKVVHQINESSCSICGKKYSRAQSMLAHMNKHSSLPHDFSCSICHDIFNTKEKLEIHVGKRHKDGFKCDHCEKTFCEMSTLREHRRTHTRERPFQCNQCGTTFTFLSTFNSHMKMHLRAEGLTEDKSSMPLYYPCDKCDKSYVNAAGLKLHKRHIHDKFTENLPCDVCGKSFRRKELLKQHYERNHTDTPKFSCEFCGQRFGRKYHLKRHITIHSGEGFPCDLCSRVLKREDSLKLHRKSHSTNGGLEDEDSLPGLDHLEEVEQTEEISSKHSKIKSDLESNTQKASDSDQSLQSSLEPLDAFVLESQSQSFLNTNIDQSKLEVLEVPVKNTQVLNDDLLMPTYRQINILDQFNDQQPVFPYQGESSTLIHNTVKRPVPKRFPNPTFLPFEGSNVEFVSTVAQNVPFPGIGLIEEQSKNLTEALFPVEHDSSILHEKQERLGAGVPFLEELSRSESSLSNADVNRVLCLPPQDQISDNIPILEPHMSTPINRSSDHIELTIGNSIQPRRSVIMMNKNKGDIF